MVLSSASLFDAMTGEYDEWYDSLDGSVLYRCELKCIKPLLDNCRRPLLEIGVGTGRFAMHYPGSFGVDPAFNPLLMAKARKINTVQSYGERLPFRDATFGCIVLILTLCFVDDPIQVLKEAKRVMRHGGSIIIGLVPEDSSWGVYYADKKRKGHPFYSRARFHSFEEIRELLRETGLTIAMIKSSLIQRPVKPYRVEEPVEGYTQEAGFLCIEAKRVLRMKGRSKKLEVREKKNEG